MRNRNAGWRARVRRLHRAFLLTVLAFAWSIALLVAALVVPVYGSATLVEENGTGVLLPVAVPAAVSVVVWVALWRKCSRGARLSDYVAWGAVLVLTAFCLLAILSIGVYVLPVAVLLGWAASLTPPGSPPARGLA